MRELEISIKNSYGIGEFHESLLIDTVDNHPSTNIIYAQNGVMKSSFAKTLRDYSRGDRIMDHIFDINGECLIVDEAGANISIDKIKSIPSFDSGSFKTGNISALLVNQSVREEYDELMGQYNDAFTVFINKLKNVSKVNRNFTSQDIVNEACSSLDSGAEKTSESLINLIVKSRDQIDAQPDFIQQLPYTTAGSQDA